MTKHYIKNILLIFSVLLAFVLVGQIWFGSYFLPTGYEDLLAGVQKYIVSPLAGLFQKDREGELSEHLQMLLIPEKIVVNDSADRRIYSEGEKGFTDIQALSDDIMRDFLTGAYSLKNKETVSMETYSSVLRGKSIFVDYGKIFDNRLFSLAVTGEAKAQYIEDVTALNGYIISLHDGILNDFSIYISDQKTGSMYRYIVEGDKTAITTALDRLLRTTTSDGQAISYAFELNFHKPQADTTTKILFAPTVLMNLQPISKAGLSVYTLPDFDQTLNTEQFYSLLREFSINTKTTNRYMDVSGARVFLENNATLTLYPDGLLSYEAVDGSRGLNLSSNKTTYDVYAATKDAVHFVKQVCEHLPESVFQNLRVATSLTDDANTPGVYTIYFDYCVEGAPLRFDTEQGLCHGIEIVLENGYVKSYKQMLKNYSTAEGTMEVLPMLSAADTLVDSLYKEETPLNVEKINLCYITQEHKTSLCWQVQVNGQEKFVE